MKFFDGFEKKIKDMKKERKKALRAAGLFIKSEYKLRLGAHVVTGNLRNSPEIKVLESKSMVVVGSPVEYAAYLEFGTSRSRAYPTLRPAIDDNTREINEILAKKLGRAL